MASKLHFYGDKSEVKNKLFTFYCRDIKRCNYLLQKFISNGWIIRAAYFNSKELNKRIM